MDTAVSLVNAYLQINGFLTVTEYPLLESAHDGRSRTVTNLDVLGFRFPHAGRELSMGKGKSMAGDVCFEPDPALGGSANLPDMIVGEVKRKPPVYISDLIAEAPLNFPTKPIASIGYFQACSFTICHGSTSRQQPAICTVYSDPAVSCTSPTGAGPAGC